MSKMRKINLQLFAMKNLDVLQQKKTEIMQKLNQAIKDGDEEAFTQAFNDLSDNIQQAVMEEARGLIQAADASILTGRGVRQLTSEENKYYQSVIEAMRSVDPKQALTSLDVVMPKTIIDAVFEDLVSDHPLLNAINFTNTSGLIEYLVNTNGNQTAVWGTLTSAIVTELTGGFKKINMSLNKLSAFLPVAKAMLDLGPEWLDRYVRAILGDAAAFGLEGAIIDGTGKNEPIGMTRQVGEGVTVTDGIYPRKNTVPVTSLSPKAYGALLASLAVGPNSKNRTIDKVIMIVNPVDYFNKVFPATTVRTAIGTYTNNVLPFPTEVIQSVKMPEGKAIIGLAKRYFMGIGTAKSGKIEYSDEYKFLEDERTYLVKLYGHGEPLDNMAFIYADITNLVPTPFQTEITNAADLRAPDARLASLSIGALELVPAFNKSIHYYTLATTNATNTITAVAKDGDGAISIKLNGAAHANGAAATWNAGANTVEITVTVDAETEVYTVVVTKS